jgi:hypothetical protein
VIELELSFLNLQKPTAFGCCAKPHLRGSISPGTSLFHHVTIKFRIF